MMKAVVYDRQGPAEEVLRLADIAVAEPGPHDVVVRLRATGLNPSDAKSRSGLRGGGMPFPLVIPHSDGAGDIIAVGSAVDPARIGERVWVWNGQFGRASGTAAECITLPSAQAVTLPEGAGYERGACAGIPLMTAAHAVRLAGLKPGMTVYVAGGAGAVSSAIIQYAKAAGCTIIASVSSDAKAQIVRRLGADHVVDYRTGNPGAVTADVTGGQGVDRLFELELAANAPLIPQILRPGGEIVAYGMADQNPRIPGFWMLQQAITLKLFLVYTLGQKDRSEAIRLTQDALAEPDFDIATVIYDGLDSVARAHRDLEEGRAIGNPVILIS